MIRIDPHLTPASLRPRIERLFELSAAKIRSIDKSWDAATGAPVFTVRGVYCSRGWTEWTQGLQFGSALLQFDATGEKWFIESGRRNTLKLLEQPVSHVGLPDHR